VDFVMEHEQMTYPEALRYLAKKYGIKITEHEQTAEEIAALNERESLFHITNFANDFFQKQLHDTETGKTVGLTYLKERGLRADIIRKFQIGYASEIKDAFSRYAVENGYKPEYLEKAGLSIIHEDKLLDRFHGRIIFPVFSIAGRVIAFGGRILDSTKHFAKYINSPESDIYHKSNVLYGLQLARTEIARKNECFLCEGYLDVISMYQAGIENIVASSGTSLTTEQIRLIKRYTPNITILYDGDAAGIKASFRGIDMILEEGMNVRIVLFPDGEDPDSFVRKNTAEDIAIFLRNNAVDFINFKTGLLLKETQNDPLKKADLVREIITSIALIPENITREAYIKQCATLMQMEEAALIYALNQVRRKNFKQKQKQQEKSVAPDVDNADPTELFPQKTTEQLLPPITDSRDIKEKEIIRMLVVHGNKKMNVSITNDDDQVQLIETTVADFILNDLIDDEISFENSNYQYLFDFFKNKEQPIISDEQVLLQHENKEIRTVVVDLLSENYTISDGWNQRRMYTKTEEDNLQFACEHALLSLKSLIIAKRLSETEQELKTLSSDNQEGQMELLNHILELTDIKKKIAALLTRTRITD
jgi:DNA primase